MKEEISLLAPYVDRCYTAYGEINEENNKSKKVSIESELEDEQGMEQQ